MLVGWLVGWWEGGVESGVVENNKWASRRIETTKTKRIYTKKLKEVKKCRLFVCRLFVCRLLVFSNFFPFPSSLICSSRFYPPPYLPLAFV